MAVGLCTALLRGLGEPTIYIATKQKAKKKKKQEKILLSFIFTFTDSINTLQLLHNNTLHPNYFCGCLFTEIIVMPQGLIFVV